MNLGRLIERLKNLDPKIVVGTGFTNAHSHRGTYEQLAFEPKNLASVGEMLTEAQAACGREFTGYEGGDYAMDETSEVYIAEYGCCGEQLTSDFFRYIDEEVDNAKLRAQLAAANERIPVLTNLILFLATFPGIANVPDVHDRIQAALSTPALDPEKHKSIPCPFCQSLLSRDEYEELDLARVWAVWQQVLSIHDRREANSSGGESR